MPVSESEKLGVFVLGCHFSEKTEHIPIKKRRFLFKTSSPPRNTVRPPLEGAERDETSPKLNSDSNLNSNSSSLSATYETVTGICERGSKDHKLDKKELVKDDDFSGISILAAAACSNSLVAETDSTPEARKTVKFKENNVKNEPVFHTSKTSSKVNESALNKEPNIQNPPARDVRFSWDLNTVMDTWEEPSVSEHEISNVEKKKVNTESQTSHAVVVKTVTRTLAVDTKFSIDCSIPPGFDHCLNLHASKENVGPITQTAMTKHDLSLKTETYVKNGHKVEDNSQCDDRAGSGIGCDSQYEDGELREWNINDWKGNELAGRENEYNMNKEKSLDLDDVVLSSPKVNELTSGQHKSESQDNVDERASQSDKWKMSVSGRDLLHESRRINSNNLNKTRNFTGRKFSYREQKDKFGTEDVEMQGRSLTYRPERESGASRSFRRGKFSPHNDPSDREGGMWNRSILEDSRSMGNSKNDGDNIRRTFRGMSPSDREVNEFRARLGLRPTEDTSHDSYVNRGRGRGRGRGRFMSYDTHGPTRDECDEPMTGYSHFPRRSRCFSPIERRGNNSYQHYRSSSRSPGFRRRSRSPGFRICRPRSPGGYRDHPSESHYKELVVFNRSPPPRTGGPRGERFSFYECERGGFGRRYAKRFHYDGEDGRGFGVDARDRRALEVHARSSVKSGGDGTDSRFRDLPRRQREGSGGFRRRSRDGKDRKEGEHMVNHDSLVVDESER